MAGGATTTNLNDTFVAALFQAEMLSELRPSVTSRDILWWFPTGNSTAASFTTLGDPGVSTAFTEGTDYTTVTDITTGVATATASEVGLMTTVSLAPDPIPLAIIVLGTYFAVTSAFRLPEAHDVIGRGLRLLRRARL